MYKKLFCAQLSSNNKVGMILTIKTEQNTGEVVKETTFKR